MYWNYVCNPPRGFTDVKMCQVKDLSTGFGKVPISLQCIWTELGEKKNREKVPGRASDNTPC